MFTLNGREIASLLWLGGIVAYALYTAPPVRQSFGRLVKRVTKPKILIPCVLMAGYTAVAVWGLYKVGAWTPALLKATLIWFFFSGLVVAFKAVGTREPSVSITKLVLFDSLKVVVLVEFFLGTYVWPWWAELLIVPVVTFIVLLGTFVESGDWPKSTRRLVTGLQVIVGFVILFGAGYQFINDYGALVSLESLKELLVVPVFSLLFIPCVGLLVLYALYEMLMTRISMGPKPEPDVKPYALWRFLRAYGFRTRKLRTLCRNRPGQLMRISTRADVDSFVQAGSS